MFSSFRHVLGKPGALYTNPNIGSVLFSPRQAFPAGQPLQAASIVGYVPNSTYVEPEVTWDDWKLWNTFNRIFPHERIPRTEPPAVIFPIIPPPTKPDYRLYFNSNFRNYFKQVDAFAAPYVASPEPEKRKPVVDKIREKGVKVDKEKVEKEMEEDKDKEYDMVSEGEGEEADDAERAVPMDEVDVDGGVVVQSAVDEIMHLIEEGSKMT